MAKAIGPVRARLRAYGCFYGCVLAISTGGAAAADVPVEDFERAGAPAPWTFWNGSEFPGATGSFNVTQGEGGAGRAGRLEGDFSGGGAYVAANFTLAQPITAPVLAFRAKSNPGTHIVVRLLDNTGQTLQYSLNRPLSALDPAAWYSQTVDVGAPSSSYGGAADKVPHPPFKSLGFLIEVLKFRDQASPYNPHWLEFDDVAFLSDKAEAIDPAAAPVPFAGSPRLDGFGVNIHFTRNDAALDALKGSGMTWLRMDLGWSGMEKSKGVYDFSAHDALVAAANARGLKVHYIVDYANALYETGPPKSAASLAAFQAFARATAAHFAGKADHFEIWNEPNIPQFWDPVDPAAYAAACAAGIAGVHAGNPKAVVSTGGVSEVDWDFVRKSLAAGGGASADAVGVHPYRGDRPETLGEQVLMLREVVRRAYPESSRAPPLWDTEWGYTSAQFGNGRTAAAQTLHARYSLRRVLASWAMGFPFIIDYDLLDDGADPMEREHNFGLLAGDLSDKPAMIALRNLAARCQGFAAKGFLATRQTDVHALKLESATETMVILWRDRAGEFGTSVELDTVNADFSARPLAAWDFLGKPRALPSETGGRTRVAAGYDPAYFIFAKSGIAARSLARPRTRHAPVLLWGGDVAAGAAGKDLGTRVWAHLPGTADAVWRDFAGRTAGRR